MKFIREEVLWLQWEKKNRGVKVGHNLEVQ